MSKVNFPSYKRVFTRNITRANREKKSITCFSCGGRMSFYNN